MTRKGSQVRVLYGPPGKRRSQCESPVGPSHIGLGTSVSARDPARLVFDPLTRTQVRQFFDILHRIKRGLDPAHTSVTTQAIDEHLATVRKRPR